MGLMSWEADNKKSREVLARRLEREEAERKLRHERLAREAAEAEPQKPAETKPPKPEATPAAGVFAGCPGLAAEKETKLLQAGYNSIAELAAGTHKDITKLLGPQLAGAARGWAAEQLRKADEAKG